MVKQTFRDFFDGLAMAAHQPLRSQPDENNLWSVQPSSTNIFLHDFQIGSKVGFVPTEQLDLADLA